MSWRHSASILEMQMPAPPLLVPGNKENPFFLEADFRNQEDGVVHPETSNFDDNSQPTVGWRRKWFCGGFLVFGLVIIGALVIFAVHQREDVPARSSNVTAETYQEQLGRLYSLVRECQTLMEGEQCQTFLGSATSTTVDNIIQNLAILIQDLRLKEDITKLQTVLGNLENVEAANNTNYRNILAILKLVIMDKGIVFPQPRLLVEGGHEKFLSTVIPSRNYSPSSDVHCDWRERRCRDKKKCYLTSQHCDLNVDCEDNSDEDSCSCVERLVGDRLCDGYLDCEDGEDERGCDCPAGTSFFCHDDPSLPPPACVLQSQVCDGREDCGNGRDEEDCYILAPSLNNISPRVASDHGYLSVWRPDLRSYLPLAVSSAFSQLDHMVQQSCRGVRGSEPTLSQVSPPSGLTVQVYLPGSSPSLVRSDLLPSGHSLISVYCGNKLCGKSAESRDKRETGRVKRDDMFNPECEEWIHSTDITELVKNETYRLKCCMDTSKASTGCSDARIVGGSVSLPEDWPATVPIYRDGVFICGGTIVSPDWVITAAHCVYGYETGHFYSVRAGMLRRQSQSPWEQRRHVEQVYYHPSYDNLYLTHDVALVRLNRPLNINGRVEEICLPHDTGMSPGPGSTCIAAGWGDLTEDGPSSDQLRHVEVPILAKCGHNYNNDNYQICGGYAEGGKDACQGDSGGPLYCRDSEDNWYLGGVISHGNGCARADEAGVYVRLSYYLAWLHDVMSGQLSPGIPGLQCPGLHCDSGECVPSKWVCDLTVDCLDGGDVRGCVTLSNGTRVQLGQETPNQVSVVTGGGGEVGTGVEFDYHSVSCSEEQFKCSSLEQCVPLLSRCDGLRDCPDWSDETGCICADLISPHNMCDGLADCRDASDEENCGLCEADQYRCALSQQCVSKSRVCDTVPDCQLEEDEKYCTALTTTDYLSVDMSGDPVPQHQGILHYRDQGTWQPICVTSFPPSLASRICDYMGYSLDSFSLESPVPVARSLENCQYVRVDCQYERCGERPVYRNLPPGKSQGQAGPGHWPWQATFLLEGQVKCGGAIVHTTFVMTELDCAKKLVAESSKRFITVLVGQDKRTKVGLTPWSQVRRVVSLKMTVSSRIVLAQLDAPLDFSEYVNKLCLASYAPNYDSCFLSGPSASSYTTTVTTSVQWCEGQLCLTSEREESQSETWSGVLTCNLSSSPGVYHGVAVYSSTTIATPLSDLSSLYALTSPSAPVAPLTDDCSGFRCRLGACIRPEQVCDRQWDCQEGEEEVSCPDISSTSLPLCARHHHDPDHCLCPAGTRRCDNNLCLGSSYWCNGVSECGDTSDEPALCSSCLGRLSLREPSKLCDGTRDCPDYEDELPESCDCPESSWRCDHPSHATETQDRGKCIDMSELCDGHDDCPDGKDEAHSECIALSARQDVEQDLFQSPVSQAEGFLKVRTYGVWYTYCAQAWSSSHTTALCLALGFQDSVEWRRGETQQASHLYPHEDLGSSSIVNCSTIYLHCTNQLS